MADGDEEPLETRSIPLRLLGGFADKPVLGVSLVVLVLLALGFLVALVVVVL